jgi:hypothetical protein
LFYYGALFYVSGGDKNFLAIDDCVTAGGVWDMEAHGCTGARPDEYSGPFPAVAADSYICAEGNIRLRRLRAPREASPEIIGIVINGVQEELTALPSQSAGFYENEAYVFTNNDGIGTLARKSSNGNQALFTQCAVIAE